MVKKRPRVVRLLNQQAEQEAIQLCRERLTHALGLFGVGIFCNTTVYFRTGSLLAPVGHRDS